MKLFISAAEPSGDIIAAEVMDYCPQGTHYIGIGGIEMEKRGLRSFFPMEELSVMGFLEVIPQALNILKRIKETANYIVKEQPDAVLTIDAYSFHSRLAKRLRKLGYTGKLHHYVPPAVWAWKEGRAKSLADLYNHVYCIFPFEPPYFSKHGIPAEFVGHPAAFRELEIDLTFKKKHNLTDQPILLLLPGSRVQEINKLLPDFIKAAKLIQTQQPLQIIIPTLPHLEALIREHCTAENLMATILTDSQDRFQSFKQANAAIAASGTVAMELALNQVPTTIGYKTSAITYWLAKTFAHVKYATVLNIIADKEVIPEFLQDRCTPENLAAATLSNLAKSEYLDEIKTITSQLKSPSGLKPQEIVAQRIL